MIVLAKETGRHPDGHEVLTPRQREVLQLLAEGRRAKEVADILNVSTKTVEFHKNIELSTITGIEVNTTNGLVTALQRVGTRRSFWRFLRLRLNNPFFEVSRSPLANRLICHQ
jgi:hypothetical protein